MNKTHKKILILCPYPEGVAPGQRLKYEQYFDSWRTNGYSLTISPFIVKPFWDIVYKPGRIVQKVLWTLWGYLLRVRDLIRAPFYDGVYIFLWVSPFGIPLFEKALLRLNTNVIYDIDDMVFLGHASAANHFIMQLKGKSKMIYLMKKAKHVITCTPKLDEVVRQYNKNTTDISSTIDTSQYTIKENYTLNKKVVLGWSGSHSTSKYLYLLKEVLLNLAEKYPIKLKVIGDQSFNIEGLEIEAKEWERKSEVEELKKIDIGLYPLPNEEWVYGKSGLKALQYMALGIPTIATDIGANKRIIENGKNGFLVNSKEEWEKRIIELINDQDLRINIGNLARQTVVDKFSVEANEKTYLDILKNNL